MNQPFMMMTGNGWISILLFIMLLSTIYLFVNTFLYRGSCLALYYYLAMIIIQSVVLAAVVEIKAISHLSESAFLYEVLVLPAWMFLLWFVLLFVINLHGITFFLHWRRNHISSVSIHDAFEAIPEGICYFSPDGVPILVNRRMLQIHAELTRNDLVDMLELWKQMKSSCIAYTEGADGVERLVVPIGDKKILQMQRHKIYAEKGWFYELISSDISTQYAMTQELMIENSRLQEMEKRLREYGSNIVSLTREKEILAAKMHVHDELGQLLLMTQRQMEEDTDREALNDLQQRWGSIAEMLEVDSGSDSGKMYAMDELRKAADSIGMEIELEGELPSSEKLQHVFLVGAMECMLNASHHGHATRMKIRVEERNNQLILQYTNNGTPPAGYVQEGGGLSLVRSAVEELDGEMHLYYEPEFMLELRVMDFLR